MAGTLEYCSLLLVRTGVFLAYDCFVERRQRKVLHTAVQSRENVLLLEQMVKERTNKLEASNAQLEEANRRVVQASEQQLKHFACMRYVHVHQSCDPPITTIYHSFNLCFSFTTSQQQSTIKSHEIRYVFECQQLDCFRVESFATYGIFPSFSLWTFPERP